MVWFLIYGEVLRYHLFKSEGVCKSNCVWEWVNKYVMHVCMLGWDMCVYVYMYVWVYVDVCKLRDTVYVFVCVNFWWDVYVYEWIYESVDVCICMCACEFMNICMIMWILVCMCIRE